MKIDKAVITDTHISLFQGEKEKTFKRNTDSQQLVDLLIMNGQLVFKNIVDETEEE